MPTSGASSNSINDKLNAAMIDNGDGTYELMTSAVSPAQSPTNQWASVPASGTTSAAPAAGTQIAAITAGQTGYYDIQVNYGYGATAESTTADNFGLYINGGLITQLLATVSQNNTLFPAVLLKHKLTAGDNIFIRNIAAGSAGSIYKAYVVATRTA